MRYIITVLLLVIAQGAIDNYVNLSVYLNIMLPMFIILILPEKSGSIAVMLAAFALGLIMDIFGNGIPGLSAAAMTAAALCRKPILRIIIPKELTVKEGRTAIESLGISHFALYSALMLAVCLSVYILVDNAGFRPVWQCLGRLGASLILNTAVMTALFAAVRDNRRQ